MRARTKTIATIAYIGTAVLAAAAGPTAAQDVPVQSVVAIDGKVDCIQMKAKATQPCEGFTPPRKLAVGELFSADGKTRQIKIIRAAQVENDFAQNVKKGEWICVAAETLADIPVDESRDRTWLTILKCQPDLPGKAPPLPPR
jgi:hypothetical protein